jgi:pyruvate dehydrogenase E1 component beta subunit
MTATITYREACRQAIREALLSDPLTFVMGEDVGLYGGCYGVTKGLLDEFGPTRLIRRLPKALSWGPVSVPPSPGCARLPRS